MTGVLNRRRHYLGAIVAQCEELVDIPNIVPFETFVCDQIVAGAMHFKTAGIEGSSMNFQTGDAEGSLMEFKGA